jgi:hypothetical protein
MAKVKILFLASNPLEQSRLTLDEEIRAITAQIRSAEHRDVFELVSGWAVRPDDLQQLLLQHKPQIVHFSGHGTGGSPSRDTPPDSVTSRRDMTVSRVGNVEQLVLIGEGGHARPMSKEALFHLFGVLRDNVRLVLLNACHSEAIAETLAEVVPCAIGMRGAITDAAAIAFATAFYRGLGFGRNIEEAFDLGKNALMNLQIPEDQAPRLFTRKGAVAPTKVVLVGPSIAAPRRVAARAHRNRSAMVEKVRTIWITGFLEQSLFRDVRVLLGLTERPDEVARPMDLLVKRPDEGERPLPSGTQVVDVFEKLDRSLLILGAPGSGKTTLLLELARFLLERADRDPTHPIPVVFPVSTWGESRKPLVEWLQDELNLRYDVPRKVAVDWVKSDQILPLLDGLDEVKSEHRAACVGAINAFRQSHGFLPLVITSRTADYDMLAEQLRLHGAIMVRPLTREQVNYYLTELGPDGERVRAALNEDSSLWELLDSPLLLNIVTAAYAGKSEAPPLVSGTMVERRDHLFGSYVNRMIQRRAVERRYAPAQTLHWLTWLAYQMASHGQAVFFLERLQLDWLPPAQRRAIRIRKRLVVALFVVLVSLPLLLLGSFSCGIAGAVIGAFAVRRVISGIASKNDDIICSEIVSWSWSRIRKSEPSILGFVIVGGLIGLLAGGCPGGLVSSVIFGIAEALRSGMSFGEIDTRAVPNQGIHRSGRNAIVFGLAAWIFIGLVGATGFGLLTSMLDNPVLGVVLGLVAGLICGLAVGLRAGGTSCLKHIALRLRLNRNGSAPWNYVQFLDQAADRMLLRKVGGGYMFVHRMLLEWFAARYVEPGTPANKQVDSGR